MKLPPLEVRDTLRQQTLLPRLPMSLDRKSLLAVVGACVEAGASTLLLRRQEQTVGDLSLLREMFPALRLIVSDVFFEREVHDLMASASMPDGIIASRGGNEEFAQHCRAYNVLYGAIASTQVELAEAIAHARHLQCVTMLPEDATQCVRYLQAVLEGYDEFGACLMLRGVDLFDCTLYAAVPQVQVLEFDLVRACPYLLRDSAWDKLATLLRTRINEAQAAFGR